MAKILVIDDSATMRDLMKTSLLSGGHTVMEASDGINGLDMLAEHQDIELVICDVNMPRLSGLGMCEQIYENSSKYKKIPIMMLTAETSKTLKENGRKYGVAAWVAKPFNGEKVLIAISKILSNSGDV